MNEKAYLIINPNRFPQYVKVLKHILKKYNQFVVIETTDLDHFISSIEVYYESGLPYLLIWGGDGTAHAAINHLTELAKAHPEDKKERSVGFLRGGSGNGIQDSYEVPFLISNQIKTYVKSIEEGYTVDVDLVKCEYDGKVEYSQLAGVGFDAQVLSLRDNDRVKWGKLKGKIKPGLFNYLKAIGISLRQGEDKRKNPMDMDLSFGRYLFHGTRVNAQSRFDHLSKTCDPLLIELGNRPYFAALFKICPHVICNSGSMNIYVYHKMRRITIIGNLFSFWLGWHHRVNNRYAAMGKPVIENFEVKNCTIKVPHPFYFHLDGDLRRAEDSLAGQYKAEFTILPSAISFLVPEGFYRKFHPEGIR